jgi:hypothetical protein
LDSDVIFFRPPEEIIRWSEEASDSIYYNEDTKEKFCNPRADLEDAMGFEIWRKFNSGLVLMQSAAMNNELAETLLAKFENSAHHPQFFEQTLLNDEEGRGGNINLNGHDLNRDHKKEALNEDEMEEDKEMNIDTHMHPQSSSNPSSSFIYIDKN